MKRLAIVIAILKACVASMMATIAIGLAFAGIAELSEWLFSDCCVDASGALVSLLRFWSSYWWFIFAVIFYPAFFSFFVIFVRRFVAAGHRLTAAGFILVFYGATMLASVIAIAASEFGRGALTTLPVYVLVAVLLLFTGSYLGWKRPRVA
jgi:hypothetical protein